MDKLVYSAKDISRMLSISMNKVYELLHEDKIPYVKIGKKFIIPKKAFENWLDTCSNVAM
jgi:excisionase family DNA binding protein